MCRTDRNAEENIALFSICRLLEDSELDVARRSNRKCWLKKSFSTGAQMPRVMMKGGPAGLDVYMKGHDQRYISKGSGIEGGQKKNREKFQRTRSLSQVGNWSQMQR